MRQLPGWMPSLLRQIDWGCANSAVMAACDDNDEAFESGRTICRELWPFIQQLPQNVASVRDALPDDMEAAKLLLSELADEERVYQQLFIKQCELARLNVQQLALEPPSPATKRLCEVMRHYCASSNYHQGILAIVTAELAATAFARSTLPLFEKYLAAHEPNYSQNEVEEGLAWMRIHTKPQTKHALWMKRMLGDLEQGSTKSLPEPVQNVLTAVFDFLHCPTSDRIEVQKDFSHVQY